MSKKRLAVNLATSFLSTVISMLFSMFVSPYIVNSVGAESYGFVSLANQFVNYIGLISIAINSMATRFITIEFHKGNIDEANKYYSSVVIANIIISVALLFPLSLMIIYLNNIITISPEIVFSIKLLFGFVFLNFIITLVTSYLNAIYFITNKLYLQSMRSIEVNFIRIGILILLFWAFGAKIYFISLTSIVITLYSVFFNIYYKKKLIPQLKVSKNNFSFKKIKILISSGIWNVVTQLSAILNEGLDLLLCNIYIGGSQMGVLAISKTMPNIINIIINSIANVFMPNLTKLYAESKFDAVVSTLRQAIKFLSSIVSVPLAGLLVFGDVFYKLWMPNQNSSEIQILSVLSIYCFVMTAGTAPIHSILTVVNKIKLNSIVIVSFGVLNTILVVLLLKNTQLSVYAIAGVSTTTSVIRNLVWTFPYIAKCLNQKWWLFYGLAFKNVFAVGLVSIICIIYRNIFLVNSWATLFIAGVICGLLGLLLNVFVFLNKNERIILINKVVNK